MTKPDITADEILNTHRSETWSTGWNNEATEKAKAQLEAAINWIIGDDETGVKSLSSGQVRNYYRAEARQRLNEFMNGEKSE